MMQTNTQWLVVVQTMQGVSIISHTMPLVTARAGPTISVTAVFFTPTRALQCCWITFNITNLKWIRVVCPLFALLAFHP